MAVRLKDAENQKLINDLQCALASTLELNLNFEHLRVRAFHKKISENSAKTIQGISDEIHGMQSTLEKFKLVKKPTYTSQTGSKNCRSLTPNTYECLPPANKGFLKEYLKISNTRVASSRAGYLPETSIYASAISRYSGSSSLSKRSATGCDSYNNITKDSSVGRFERNATSREKYLGRDIPEVENMRKKKNRYCQMRPEDSGMMLRQHALDFKRIQSNKNSLLLEKLKEKLVMGSNNHLPKAK